MILYMSQAHFAKETHMSHNQSKQNSLEKRVDELLQQMTLQEKIALLSGKDAWSTVPIHRLGIPSITMTDGPHGVRSVDSEDRESGPATCFPTGISMGASWNPDLIEKIGAALGEETRGLNCEILLGPCVNIVREPRGGRNFETYSEDPYLAGKTAVAFINGVQSQNVGTSLKHYAANNYEIERFRANSNVDERTLREIYLSQFEMAVKESKPWTVMCSYNRVNGTHASQHDYLLNKILKEEWAFEGLVVSDWGANHTIFSSVAGGLDLEMPGPAKYYKFLGEAVWYWQIDEEAVNKAARRVLRIVLMANNTSHTLEGKVNTPEHQSLARQLAEEAITLLKNNDILPLDLTKIKTVAIIGPNAAKAVIQGGGSSHVTSPYRVSPLEALQAKLGDKVQIIHEQGCDNFDQPPVLPLEWLTSPDGTSKGMKMDIYQSARGFDGPCESSTNSQRTKIWRWLSPIENPEDDHYAIRCQGNLFVPVDGKYTFQLNHMAQIKISINNEVIFKNKAPNTTDHDGSVADLSMEKELRAGQTYDLKIEYIKYPDQRVVYYELTAAILYSSGGDPRLPRAIEAAKQADVVLAFIGTPEEYETEGDDRSNIEIPGQQNQLVTELAAANPNTIVVLNNGAPVTMPWIDQVAALVEAFYPGQENGNAIANILLGKTNPSGKLPITFPKHLEDNPAYINTPYKNCREVIYGEGIFVGYRYYDKKNVEPLFPFGHGLSYTSFAYENPKVISQQINKTALDNGECLEISLTVTNTGNINGKEVVQLYVTDLESSLPRPPKELKGFAKVALQVGESRQITFKLNQRSFAFYDPYKKHWVAEPGEFEILFGSSSRDIRAKVNVSLE